MLDFIGTGSAFNVALGNNGGYIKKDDTLFMIDCGSSTFERLMRSGLLEGVTNINVLITHTHPDHIGSLGDLIFYGYFSVGEIGKPNVRVYSTLELKIKGILRAFGVEDDNYVLEEFESLKKILCEDMDLMFEAVPVNHVKTLKSFGYIFDYQGKKVYYSGDANEIPSDILKDLNEGKFDEFYQDTCKAEYPGNVHLPLSLLDELVDMFVRDRVYCMHLDESFIVEEALKLGFNVVKSSI